MDEGSYKPIACGDYDFLEIACMYNYDLQIVTAKLIIHGRALTIENYPKGEFLIIALEEGQHQSIRIDSIQKIIVKTKYARFDAHTFNTLGKEVNHSSSASDSYHS